MKCKGLVNKNISCNGNIISIVPNSIIDLDNKSAYILASNGFVSIEEIQQVSNIGIYDVWGKPKTSNRKLKKYLGNKTNLCINADSEYQALVMNQKYNFDDCSCSVGKYRFYGGDWNSQIQKRNSYLKEDRINVIIDTDETLHGDINLPSNCDVGWVKITNNGIGERWQPRVFRGVEGIHYLKRHHWIFDGNGDLIASHSSKGNKYKHVNLNVLIDNAQDSKFDSDDKKSFRQKYREHIFEKELCHPESDIANMYICHINNEDMAGLSVRLSDAINKYTRHSSISFRSVDNYLNFKKDRGTDDKDYGMAVDTADVIVFNEIYPINREQFKPTIMIHHGTWYRNHLESSKKLDDVADLILGTTTDLLQHDKRMLYLPSVVDTDYLKQFKSEPEYEIAHTTTSRVKKGTDEILKYLPDIHIIEGLSYNDAMIEKGKARIVIDQISDIGIGLGAIEAMAMGIPVISCAGKEAIKKYEEIFGLVPFTNCTPENLPKAVKYVQYNYDKLSVEAEKFVNKYHSAEVCAKRFEKLCFMVLKGKKISQGDIC